MKRHRYILLFCVLITLVLGLSGCDMTEKKTKIGVSIVVGDAERWKHEKVYMEERAKALGVDIEVRLRTNQDPALQTQDCIALIDSGIDVLVLTPQGSNKVMDILAYAKKKNIPVITYARVIAQEQVDLFVGYDTNRIGQRLGQYLSEKVSTGTYILLKGDPDDRNAQLIYEGAMRYISLIKNDIHIILDAAVLGWSPQIAKQLVMQAVAANNNQIDAILAPNDRIAGACAEALAELGVTHHVAITGMDTELDAVKRIVDGKQDVTIYMDLKELAYTAVNEAYHIARQEKVNINADFDVQGGVAVNANLITGQLVTKENIDRLLIQRGYFTKEQVYGK